MPSYEDGELVQVVEDADGNQCDTRLIDQGCMSVQWCWRLLFLH